MKNILGFIVLLIVALGCSSFSKKETPANTTTAPSPAKETKPDAPATTTSASDLTMEKFDKLSTGMKYDEAVKILGSEGTETSSSTFGNNKTASYKWEGADNARITATFKNGELTSKSQSYLKSASGTAPKADLTMAKYEQLQNGMTYADAVKVIGSEGTQTSNSQSGSYKMASYKWEGDKFARIYASFKDDKLSTKSQSSLK